MPNDCDDNNDTMTCFRHFIAIVTFGMLFLLGSAVHAGDAFFAVLEDLPIMEGLAENQAASVTFETANGRIAEVEASGSVEAAAVRAFYAEILPQLGWQRVGEGLYSRDQERLQLVVSDAGGGRVIAAFSLSPKPH